eukprot:TRINITY_DN8650_c0_g1_i1.p1 TRINITY_DN8650_c0_g1~~TRINITY_DN8650_c0_g1_i1.p1  ORF type:complete len:126 (-),score=8.69 TRINITY_DN8650_c0_g1_i1:49-426(-)
MRLIKYAGHYITATGIFHNLVGLFFGGTTLLEMHRDGWFRSTINPDSSQNFERETIFWFLVTGASWMLTGGLMQHFIDKGFEMPRFLGWSILALGLSSVFIMPESGFYLLLPVAYSLITSKVKED